VKSGLLAGYLLICMTSTAAANTTTPVSLRVYGPGGPHHVIKECADLFQKERNIEVKIIKALPYTLGERLRTDGDIYYGGAEYMLENFINKNPDVLNLSSVTTLHPRRIGIIVRKGNPHNIKEIKDLYHEEIDILDVKLENMRHFHTPFKENISNIRHFEFTGQQGSNAWLRSPEIDAWITYKSWHIELEEHSEFVELQGDGTLRYIPIALTQRTTYPNEASEFIAFLQSDKARAIFSDHGWE